MHFLQCRDVLYIIYMFSLSSHKKHISLNVGYVFLFLQDDYDGLWNVVAFLVAFMCCVCQVARFLCKTTKHHISGVQFCTLTQFLSTTQCQLYLFHSARKKIKSLTLLTVIVLCNGFLFGLRNVWQLAFHMSVAFLSTLLILNRKLLDRSSDCEVWVYTHTLWRLLVLRLKTHEVGHKVGRDTWRSQASNRRPNSRTELNRTKQWDWSSEFCLFEWFTAQYYFISCVFFLLANK